MTTDNVHKKFDKVWACGFWDMWVERQTHRHRHTETSQQSTSSSIAHIRWSM